MDHIQNIKEILSLIDNVPEDITGGGTDDMLFFVHEQAEKIYDELEVLEKLVQTLK